MTSAGDRRDLAFDVAAVLAAAVIGVVIVRTGAGGSALGDGLALVGGIVLAVSLWRRRRNPVTVAWISAGATTAVAVLALAAPNLLPGSAVDSGSDVFVPAAAPFAVYSAVRYARTRPAAWAPVAVIALAAIAPWEASGVRARTGLLLVGVPVLLGLYVAARADLRGSLLERAERAEREQHLLAEQARAEERARLAAEMHDTVSHQVSLMVLQAGAMTRTAADPGAREAAESLRSRGCQALDELRALVGVLRGAGEWQPGGAEPQPEPLPDLAVLMDASASGGVSVRLTTTGRPLLLAPAAARAAYRVVQEALTNVRKHAPGAEVQLEVHYRGDRVALDICNSAPTADSDPALTATGSGTGLAGLRSRVELLGGAMEAEALPEGGFRVRAKLPAGAGQLSPGAP